jgi:hypothetical protein
MAYQYRQRVFGRVGEFIDPKGEYGQLIDALGGVTLRLAPGGGVRLNPLTQVGSREMREGLLEAVTRAYNAMQSGWRQFPPNATAANGPSCTSSTAPSSCYSASRKGGHAGQAIRSGDPGALPRAAGHRGGGGERSGAGRGRLRDPVELALAAIAPMQEAASEAYRVTGHHSVAKTLEEAADLAATGREARERAG